MVTSITVAAGSVYEARSFRRAVSTARQARSANPQIRIFRQPVPTVSDRSSRSWGRAQLRISDLTDTTLTHTLGSLANVSFCGQVMPLGRHGKSGLTCKHAATEPPTMKLETPEETLRIQQDRIGGPARHIQQGTATGRGVRV